MTLSSFVRTGSPRWTRPLVTIFTLALLTSMLVIAPVLAAPPAGDLDQCANGGVGGTPVQCGTGSSWQNGNLNGNQAHYNEGDSVPYRLRFSNLATGATVHTVTIEWDTTPQNGKHALDYLTSFNRTETNANPCQNVTNCDYSPAGATSTTFGTGSYDTEDIPADPNVTGAGVTPVAGEFILFGNSGATLPDITDVSAYTLIGTYAGASKTRVTISFTTPVSNPVLAWGGHIATRLDWGVNNSAVAINGSPYHMRLIDVDGKGGNQDRSLSSDAVIFPAAVTIVKDVAGGTNAADFAFTTTGADSVPAGWTAGFSLDDDGTNSNPLSSSLTFTFSSFGAANTRTVTETDPSPTFSLTGLVCVENPGGLPQNDNSTVNLGSRTATLILEEAELVTCTYTNTLQSGTLTVIKNVVNDNGGTATAANFSVFVKDGTNTDVTGSPAAGSATGTLYTLPPGSYTVGENTPLPAGYSQTSITGDCSNAGAVTVVAGQSKTCTINNDDSKATPTGATIQKWILHDRITISGIRAGAPDAATANVVFRLYSNNTCTTLVSSETDSTIVSGVASTSTGIEVTSTGFYYWRAQYSGDQYNNGFNTACGTEVTQIQAKDDTPRDNLIILP